MTVKVTANEIQRRLMGFVRGTADIVLPNFFYGNHEADLLRITNADFVYEYEIKISRADFFADFKKGKKHQDLSCGTGRDCPNRFFFVVPKGLVTISEIPDYAGLIEYGGSFEIVKSGKLLHKTKFTNYRWISRQTNSREVNVRQRLNALRNYDHEKEIQARNQVEKTLRENYQELQKQYYELKSDLRRLNKTNPTP